MEYMAMVTERLKRIRMLLVAGIVVVSYLLQVYRDGIGSSFSVSTVAIILLNSFLLGLLAYFGITLIHSMLQRFKSSADANANDFIVASEDLCSVCDDVTSELHHLITDSIQLPEFDSDLVDDMNKGVTSSWLTPCAAFSYGLVVISMLKRDLNFLQSGTNKNLQNHVLQTMADKVQETSLICKSEENTNQEVVDDVAEDLKVVIRAVLYYFKKHKDGAEAPFGQLVEFLVIKVHRDLVQKLPDIEDIAGNFLSDIDNYIESASGVECIK